MSNIYRTNQSDWSAFVPVLPEAGPRRQALYREIRRMIEVGTLAAGTKLPTTRNLALRFGLSRGAAVAAYDMLVADGFAEARVGDGTYVAMVVPVRDPEAPSRANHPRSEPPFLPGVLGASSPDERSMQIFRALLQRHLAKPSARHFHYNEPGGGKDLREAIASYLRAARGVNCVADQVIVTSGTQHALDLVVRTLLSPGDRIWVEDPCYPSARAAFQAAGLMLAGIPVDGEGINVAEGMRLAPRARAAYVTPSHQFPLGVTLSMARRLELIDWARREDAYVIEDDYDSEFRYSGPPLTSLQGIDGQGRVIYVGTFSKALMPGLRIGYLVVPWAMLDAVLDTRRRSDRFPSTLGEEALAEFLREGHFSAHIKRARRRARIARDALVGALAGSCLDVTTPEQGLHLVAGLPEGVEDTDLPADAAHCGFGIRALSPMYLGTPRRQGLVVGFSGFASDLLSERARAWVTGLRL